MNEQALLGGFDSSQIPPSTGGGGFPVSGPDGHIVSIQEHEVKANNNAATGSHIAIVLVAHGGPADGMKHTIRLNLGHTSSAKAVEIAKQELSTICWVCGHVGGLQSIQQLYNKQFRVVVVQDGEYTKVSRYLNLDKSKPGQVQQQGNAAPAAPAPAGFPQPGQTAPAPAQQLAPPVNSHPAVQGDTIATQPQQPGFPQPGQQQAPLANTAFPQPGQQPGQVVPQPAPVGGAATPGINANGVPTPQMGGQLPPDPSQTQAGNLQPGQVTQQHIPPTTPPWPTS